MKDLRQYLKQKLPQLPIDFGWHLEGREYPYATITERFTTKEYTHSGPAGLKRSSFQIDVWGGGYKQVTELTLAVEEALDQYGNSLIIDEMRIETENDKGEMLVRGTIRGHVWL